MRCYPLAVTCSHIVLTSSSGPVSTQHMLPCMTSDHMAHNIKASQQPERFLVCWTSCNLYNIWVMQLLFAEDDLTQWQWYRSACHQTSATAATHPHSRDATGAEEAGHHAGFQAIPGAVKRLYVPSQDDIHHSLRVQCKPASRWVITATLCTVLQTSSLLAAASSSKKHMPG